METLANIESFLRSAKHQSFSKAARELQVTPASVSRNVAMLERNLHTRLFHRTTRSLVLTDAGERLVAAIGESLDVLQNALANAASGDDPNGTLRVSMSPTFGINHIMPLLPQFMQEFPRVKPEWHFENRPVDLVAEGYDVAIGGGFDLSPGVISRSLAPAHIVAVASPSYLAGKALPDTPDNLSAFNGIVMRSSRTSLLRHWKMQSLAGDQMSEALPDSLIVDGPTAMVSAARLGLGIAFVAVADAIDELEKGELVRVLPNWYADLGTISIYYSSRKQLPARTRAFVEFTLRAAKRHRFHERFAAASKGGT